MSNKYFPWTAIFVAAVGSIAHAQSIPEPKSSLVPIGKAQPAAITPTKPVPGPAAPPVQPLVLLAPATKPVPNSPKLAAQAKTATVPAKLATQAKTMTPPAKAVQVMPPTARATATPVVAAPQPMSLTGAGSVTGRSGAATISEIAANHANALARAAAVKTTPPTVLPSMSSAQIVPELTPGQVIPVLMTSSTKARTPPPPRPYIAAIIGLKGQEIVEVQPGDGNGYSLRVGDSIQHWLITRIADGRVHMATTEYSKKKRVSESKSRIVAVGDSL